MILRISAALGMEEDQPRPGEFLDAEQIQFLAQLAVVALLGFFELGQVLVQILLGEERRAVDALQLRVLLVALPVGARDRKQLERLDLPVDGTCGPRQKSMKCGPSVYSEKTSSAFSSISSRFIQSSLYFCKPVFLLRHARARREDPCACSSHMCASIFSRSSGVKGVSRWKS